MSCCAVGPCDRASGDPRNPGCPLCDGAGLLPQPEFKDEPTRKLRDSDLREGTHSPVARRAAKGSTKKSNRRGPAYIPVNRRI